MPLYEYRCSQCGATTEKLVCSTDDQSAFACGKCGGKKLEKLMSRVSVHNGGACGDDCGPSCGEGPGACGMPSCGMNGSCPKNFE